MKHDRNPRDKLHLFRNLCSPNLIYRRDASQSFSQSPRDLPRADMLSPLVFTLLPLFIDCVLLDLEYTLFYVTEEVKDIQDTELTFKNLGENVKYLEVKRYKKDEEQVDLVAGMPHLEKFFMVKVGQQVLPNFEHLPRIKEIYMDKNELVYLKKGAVSETNVEVLHFNYNDIKVIERGTFGYGVEVLRLSCNRLKKFSPRWFRNASSLVELHMSANLLTSIEKDQFRPFSQLAYIDFSMNRISTIGENAFRNRHSFSSILLQHNRLLEITPNAFGPGNITVDHLSLTNNRLTYISREFLDRIRAKLRLQVDDNPWQCKCWDNINAHVPKNVLIAKNIGNKCVASVSFDEHCVPVIATELIDCYDKQMKIPHFNKDTYCHSFRYGL